MSKLPLSEDTKRRFLSKILITDGCWEWQGAQVNGRYGNFAIKRKGFLAHRLAIMCFIGPIPKGMYACHKCDNGLCVRPSHLFLGSQKDNMVDMYRKQRNNNIKGEQCHMAKITADIAKAIRSKFAAGGHTKRGLAREYGISRNIVRPLLSGRTWKHAL